MRPFVRAALASFAPSLVLFGSPIANAYTLYDGSAGGSPASQGKLSHYSIPGLGVETVAGGKTTYDSTAANAEYGGYSNDLITGTPVDVGFPTLDRSTGFTVSLDMKLLAESHVSNDRSGFSLIALASDHVGIELSFWTDEIFAKSTPSPTFPHGEGVSYAPTAATTTYDLTISGSSYSLYGNGSFILSGSLRDYSAFGIPYSLSNYLFIGDDTTSASASFEFSRLAVTVPEPSYLSIAAMAGAAVFVGRCRQRQIQLCPYRARH